MMVSAQDIKGVIFDIDGVLLDSLEIWKDLGARYLVSLGLVPEQGLGDILFSMSMEQGAEYLKDHYPINKTAEDILEVLSSMLRDFYYYEVGIKPGAENLLRSLRDAGICITAATSSPREYVEKALERNGLLGYISSIFTNSEIGKSKHFPDIYNAAAAYMGTSPEETLVIEDSLYAVNTAVAAGYHTIGIADPDGEPDQEGLRQAADLYIMELRETEQLFD
jgi:HAD superfamily hydrolase (TIGR01509 family)